MALKFDISKVYNCIGQSFLKKVLSFMGFSERWIHLILREISIVSFFVLVNGILGRVFKLTRRLRQGEPFFPYLIVIYAKAFSSLSPWQTFPSMALKFFIDLLLSPICCPQMMTSYLLNKLLKKLPIQPSSPLLIRELWGQKINIDKSDISFSRNVPPTRSNELAMLFAVKDVESQGKYLGLPSLICWSKSQVFQFVKDRVWKKLEGQKERSLSKASKNVLIKIVVQSIPTYALSCFKLPSSLIGFFWVGEPDSRKLHQLSWENMVKSKKLEGLDFRRIKAFNKAMFAK